MLSYISKTVSKAYKASKRVIIKDKQAYKQTNAYKLIRGLQKYQCDILPTNKLNDLAIMSYELQQFQLIFEILLLKINAYEQNFVLKQRYLKQFRNILTICSYLIKNGAGGFIDQFRQQIPHLQSLANFNDLQINIAKQQKAAKKYEVYLEENYNKIKYIVELLNDKNKLIKQKQISMLVKQKILTKQKQNISKESNLENEIKQGQNGKLHHSKIDSFLQNYLWRYVHIIDGKIDDVAEILASKIQKYLLQEVPESFSIQQIQIKNEPKIKTQTNFAQNKIKQEQSFINKRQTIEKTKKTQQDNLLQI